MEQRNFARLLPTKPPEGLLSWVKETQREEIGEELILFASEWVPQEPNMYELMDNITKPKKVLAARCTCTACQEDFVTQKVTGADAVYLFYSDDGNTYPADINGNQSWDGYSIDGKVPIGEGDSIDCLNCGQRCTVMPAKKVRGGRTKAIQVAALHVIDGCCTVIYWMVTRKISEFSSWCDVKPRDAFILTERGTLLHYSHSTADMYGNLYSRSGWQKLTTTRDTWDKLYHDWGSIGNKKRGTAIFPTIPSLIGTTGEKTGLHTYWQKGGCYAVTYLKLWKKFRSLENLVTAGHIGLVDSILEPGVTNGYTPQAEMLNLRKTKPHEILDLTKAEYKRIAPNQITVESLEMLKHCRVRGSTEAADLIISTYWRCGRNGMNDLLTAMDQTGEKGISKILNYLEKQRMRPNEAHILLDTRRMAREQNNGQPLTEEQLWPRRLMDTHDRLAELVTLAESREKAMRYQAGFDTVRKACAPLEWNDGDLCILLPRCNQDLVEEGRVLRHCVGGYGKSHSRGVSLIFFVRHYRRPERSYYTLNISMGLEPVRIQLHGYGNERHGPKKEYHHSIPQKVLDFCARWEREVLRPYCQEHYKNEERTA